MLSTSTKVYPNEWLFKSPGSILLCFVPAGEGAVGGEQASALGWPMAVPHTHLPPYEGS